MSEAYLQGRVFDRFRLFEKLPEDQRTLIKDIAEKVRAEVAATNVVEISSKDLTALVQQQLGSPTAATADVDSIVKGLVLVGSFAFKDEASEAAVKLVLDDASAILVPALTKSDGATSVWDVRDGALLARVLTTVVDGGQVVETYVVANYKQKKIALFDSDISTKATLVVDGSLGDATVQFDDSVEFGVKFATPSTTLVFNVGSKESQDGWVNALQNVGASYVEVFGLNAADASSIYAFTERTITGEEFPLSSLHGKVVLVVNVSSECGLTPTNYPELSIFHDKYHAKGLEIIAAPCNQFGAQEPGTNEEIAAFVKQYDAKYTFLEKRDVNGPHARPLFSYLRQKLIDPNFGTFVKWNFTKFLVDRSGQPAKRYSPRDLPLSFEADIVELLERSS